jgi:hypothetical protein
VAGPRRPLHFSTLVAPSPDDALALADEYDNPETFERAVTLA